VALLFAISGCTTAAPGSRSAHPSTPHLAATRPVSDDPKADLALEDIDPPVNSLPAPATQPSTPAPLDAIQLYAQARSALIDNRVSAVALLERAAKLDPYSLAIHYDLGRAYLAASPNGTATDRALAAFDRAAELHPDDVDLQLELGRQYLNRGDVPRALSHLRLARLTSAYRSDKRQDAAALVDFFLARALRQSGYTAAALQQYDSLLNRLAHPAGFTGRTNPELIYFLRHPQILYTEIGELYEKRGDHAEALEAYELALKNDPESTELAARVVRASLKAGNARQARQKAMAMAASSHGTSDSLELLREVCEATGGDTDYTNALAVLHAKAPQDRLIFYALLDRLETTGRGAEAERLLIKATADTKSDPDYTRRLFALYQKRDDIESAMRLLVSSLADRPDSLRDVGLLWTELLKPARRGKLRLATLQQMKVPPREEAARLFWVSRLAEIWNRDALARSTLQQAAALKPAFAPVYRWLVLEYWQRPDWDDQQKIDACEQLAATAEVQGDKALAAELRGRSLLSHNDADGAARAFAAAEALGSHSPDLQLMRARAVRQQGNDARCEQLLWRLLSDWPQYEDAYYELLSVYLKRGAGDQAISVLQKWLTAIPTSVSARQLKAAIIENQAPRQPEAIAAAEAIYIDMLNEQPENLEVLKPAEAFFRRHGKIDQFIERLEAVRAKDPDNREAVEVLVGIYADEKRLPDASRVLDSAREAVAKDPDLLYYVAHLYERIDQRPTMLQLLEEVVQMDPGHAAASNDLGYTWADEGKNLDRAEQLVRVAVDAEPDNQSYLDSMAWVEYKRGKFAEAREYLDRAIGPANRPDPVVLDHLGDTLYRLDRPKDAAKQWTWSLKRVEESTAAGLERDDLKELKLHLLSKLKQQEAGRPVDVAPVVEMPKSATQARKGS
jgi:tetratricopeptide (TPR) repeat protein